jgi:hypothetical protein
MKIQVLAQQSTERGKEAGRAKKKNLINNRQLHLSTVRRNRVPQAAPHQPEIRSLIRKQTTDQFHVCQNGIKEKERGEKKAELEKNKETFKLLPSN